MTIDSHVRHIIDGAFDECEKLEEFEVYNQHFLFNDEDCSFLMHMGNEEWKIIWQKGE